MTARPAYRVPTMAEIAALPWNGFTAASTFSGCGGSSLGYRMAGFRVLYASEFVEAARETYRANAAPYTHLDDRDIRDVTPGDLLARAGVAAGELDLLDGSPPCASFSTSGKRQRGWGESKKYSDTEQRSDDLFFEFARILAGVQPRVFVAENVSGLVKGAAKGYFLEILRALKGAGYRVEAKLLDAQWLGVPQARQRLIFVGVRDDLPVDPVHPDPLPYQYSLRDALTGYEPSAIVTTPGSAALPDDVAPTIEPYAIYPEWRRLRQGEVSRRYLNLIRGRLNAPCPTVTATAGSVGAAGVTHPTEPRKFSLGELRRICGFPDDFALPGPYAQGWERLGRAVPPVMMAQIGGTVRDYVLTPAKEQAA